MKRYYADCVCAADEVYREYSCYMMGAALRSNKKDSCRESLRETTILIGRVTVNVYRGLTTFISRTSKSVNPRRPRGTDKELRCYARRKTSSPNTRKRLNYNERGGKNSVTVSLQQRCTLLYGVRSIVAQIIIIDVPYSGEKIPAVEEEEEEKNALRPFPMGESKPFGVSTIVVTSRSVLVTTTTGQFFIRVI